MLEADKLARRNARPPETLFAPWLRLSNVERPCRRKSRPSSRSWRRQGETLPKQWTRPRKRASNVRRRSISSRQTVHGKGRVWYPQPSDTFQALSENTEALNLMTQLDAAVTGLSGLLAAATPTPSTTGTSNSVDTAVKRLRMPRTMHTCVFRLLQKRRRISWTKSVKPRSKSSRRWSSKNKTFSVPGQRANTVYCACSRAAALGERPSWKSLANCLVGHARASPYELLQRTRKKRPGRSPQPTQQLGNQNS